MGREDRIREMGRGTRRHRPCLFETVESRELAINLQEPMSRELAFPPLTPTQGSLNSKIDRKSCVPQTRARNAKRRAPRPPSGSPRWNRLVLQAATSAAYVGVAESYKLPEFPSAKCLWMELPHAVQIAILLGMVVLFFKVNQYFNKLDRASYARLSIANTALAEARERTATRQTGEIACTAGLEGEGLLQRDLLNVV